MTAPVETGGRRIAMTVPVEQDGAGTMRFFLPRAVAAAGAPAPTEPGIRLVEIPAERIAALRFSGRLTPEARAAQARILADVLAAAGRRTEGAPFVMGYDPPSRSRSCAGTRWPSGWPPREPEAATGAGPGRHPDGPSPNFPIA